LKRLEALGKHVELATLVARPDGSIAVLGTAKGGLEGFYLRLRADGKLQSGFGADGLLRPPFVPETAVGGAAGSLFVAGRTSSKPYGRLRTFRVLAEGKLDPRWGGPGGHPLPLSGIKVHLTSLGDGRFMATDNGNSFCRSACVARPAIARFRE
jgi:hypothetical protein